MQSNPGAAKIKKRIGGIIENLWWWVFTFLGMAIFIFKMAPAHYTPVVHNVSA